MLNGNDPETFINGQRRPEFSDIPYGRSTVGRSGCEAIACCNAMRLIGRPLPFAEVRAYFEKLFRRGMGWLSGGFLGASPLEIRLFLRKNRVPFRAVRSVKHFERLIRSERGPENASAAQAEGPAEKILPGVLIVSYWNKPLLKYGYHTVAVDCRAAGSCGENGAGNAVLTVYNRFNYSEGPEQISGLGELMEGNWRFIRGFYIPY